MNGLAVLVGLALVTWGVERLWGVGVADLVVGGFLLMPSVLRTVAASVRRSGPGERS